MRRRTLWIVLGVGFVGVAGAVVLRPRPILVEAGQAQRGAFVESVTEEGRTRARERYVVSAPLGGLLARVALEPGDPVEAGDVLARLAPTQPPLLDARTRAELEARLAAAQATRRTAQARVEQAEAVVTFAQQEAARVARLVENGIATAQDLDRTRSEADARAHEVEAARFAARAAAQEVFAARAALQQARGAGDPEACCEIPSPVSGAVLRVLQQSEAVVAPGQPILEVGDPSELEVVVALLTEEAARVHPGAPARLTRWGGEGALAARVRQVEPSARTEISALGVEEQRVDVILDLVEPGDGASVLGDGYRVEAEIQLQSLKDVVTVPAGALFRTDDTWAAYVLEAGRARLRALTLGPRSDTRAVVETGLEPGEHVVLHPTDQVHDGVRVVSE